ncbi:MAG TPA: NAD(P)-binding protein [Chitinophagaceae bacterium]|nr:NAD(P)-binding protein [Chitinophagaceae bacterium]
MNNKKVNIIGGGMAGLCSGSYLQMNGYEASIFEMDSTPGGVCTSWQRGKYTVDLCLHWLVGSGHASSFYERWSELIDLGEINFVNHDEFFRVDDGKGNYINVFSDINKLEQEFLQKAPEDRKEISLFIHALRKLATFDMPHRKGPGTCQRLGQVKTVRKKRSPFSHACNSVYPFIKAQAGYIVGRQAETSKSIIGADKMQSAYIAGKLILNI